MRIPRTRPPTLARPAARCSSCDGLNPSSKSPSVTQPRGSPALASSPYARHPPSCAAADACDSPHPRKTRRCACPCRKSTPPCTSPPSRAALRSRVHRPRKHSLRRRPARKSPSTYACPSPPSSPLSALPTSVRVLSTAPHTAPSPAFARTNSRTRASPTRSSAPRSPRRCRASVGRDSAAGLSGT
ncbi:hypothetical protein B0H15DRAFT_847125 [Mycena belliarum]|uniref:Uncharacterized protein n=1 Tax=Mycena belliarum TaxID=1033014 RepID=A0AAD6U565_9AGAR|nr:hypothetical protein B0H15DRAFT_847125 [Mycena belliae]